MKVIHERYKCIGCGACIGACPKYWEMDDDGKSRLKGGKLTKKEVYVLELKDAGCCKEAEDLCPVQCIHVK